MIFFVKIVCFIALEHGFHIRMPCKDNTAFFESLTDTSNTQCGLRFGQSVNAVTTGK